MVLGAGDVGQHDGPLALLDQAHGDAGHWVLDRHAGVHHAQGAATDAGHRGGAVALQDVADDADGVGEVLTLRQDGAQGTLGQLPVAQLAAARAALGAHLTDGEGREVVVQHELLRVFLDQRVQDALGVLHRAEGRHGEGLRLPAGEHGGAVRARQQADLAGDLTDLLRRAPVGAAALVEDLVPHDAVLDLRESAAHVAAGRGVLVVGVAELLDGIVSQGGRRVLALALVLHAEDLLAALQVGRLDQRHGLLHVGGRRPLGGGRLAADLLDQLADQVADLDVEVVAALDGGDDVILRQGLGGAFDHDDGVARAADHQVQLAGGALFVAGVDDELVIDQAHAATARRAQEGGAADAQRGRAADHAQDVRVVVRVGAQHPREDLDLVLIAVREQGAQRPVDQAAGQDLLGRGAALPLDDSAGELARRILLLAILHAQREEVHVPRIPARPSPWTGQRYLHSAQQPRRPPAWQALRFRCSATGRQSASQL